MDGNGPERRAADQIINSPWLRNTLTAGLLAAVAAGIIFYAVRLSGPGGDARKEDDANRPGAVTPGPRPPLPAAIDETVTKAMAAWGAPGAAVAVVRGDDVYLQGYGVRRAGSPEPVTPDTLFPLASCTKAFTTTAMAILVDEGKMAWDDKVSRHVPFFHLADPLADKDVRLRDLVCHRTGVGPNDLLWYRSPWDRDEIIRRVGRVPLKYPFRSRLQYQSTMFAAAGVAVEHASGMAWHEFVRTRVCEPLGMKNVVFTTTAAERAPDHATPHRMGEQGKAEPIPWYPMPEPNPAGSMCAGARDLARWVRFQLGDGTAGGKRLVSARSLEEMHTPQMVIRLEGQARAENPVTTQLSYGMAWVIQDYRGRLQWAHAGAIDGFGVHLALLPGEGLGIVLLSNLDRRGLYTDMNLALSNTLVDRLLGFPDERWNEYFQELRRRQAAEAAARRREHEAARRPGRRPPRDLAAYAGAYEHPAYGTATVTRSGAGLVWQWNAFTVPLEYDTGDTFTLTHDQLGRQAVVFTADPKGTVTGMRVEDAMDGEFHRVR